MAIETETTKTTEGGTPAKVEGEAAKGSTGAAAPAASLLGSAGAEQTEVKAEGTGEAKKDGGEAKAQESTDLKLKLPEGVDEKAAEPYVALAKKHGLKAEAAQEFFDAAIKAGTEARSAVESEITSTWEKTKQEWTEQARTDKEYGGADFKANLGIAFKAAHRLGGDALIDALNRSGAGNHPEVIRAFFRAGKLISEDSISGTTGATKQQPTEKDRLKAEFPNSPQMWE